MPVFAADVLPDTTGRNLGSPSQRWNVFADFVDIGGAETTGGVIYAAIQPVTATANVTTPQNLCTCVIPAGLLNSAGKVLRATLAGTYTTQAGQAPGMQIFMTFGTVPIFAIGTGALVSSMTNGKWRVQWEMAVYVAGTSGQVNPSGTMATQQNAGSNNAIMEISLSTLVGPVDLTVAENLLCQVAFTTNTSPANVCTQNQFIVEVSN